jgi:hypothetical protein
VSAVDRAQRAVPNAHSGSSTAQRGRIASLGDGGACAGAGGASDGDSATGGGASFAR